MKKIRLRRVTAPHYVVEGMVESRSARRLLSQCGDATDAIVATRSGRLVGFVRWFDEDGEAVSAGTWVDPKLRRRGLAKRMWRCATLS